MVAVGKSLPQRVRSKRSLGASALVLSSLALALALATPAAKAEPPGVEAPAAAAEAVPAEVPVPAAEAASTELVDASGETAPPPVEPVAAPAEVDAPLPPAEAVTASPPPVPQARETVEGAASAAETSVPSEVGQLVDVERTRQELAAVADQAVETGKGALDAAAKEIEESPARAAEATASVRELVPSAMRPPIDALPGIDQDEAAVLPGSGGLDDPAAPPPSGFPQAEVALSSPPRIVPAATDVAPPSTLSPIADAAPQAGGSERARPASADPAAEPPRIVDLIGSAWSPQEAGAVEGTRSKSSSQPPAPAPPVLDAVTTAAGATGSALLWALLALAILVAPTFASKLRMHAGCCRPAPFVSLLERPG